MADRARAGHAVHQRAEDGLRLEHRLRKTAGKGERIE
jgi:hypothetical protein